MKPHAFIFHGTAGFPEENWFPWLKEKLEALGFEVAVPQFPTPEGQSLAAWMGIVKPWINKFDSNAIIIGHSLGGVFTLKLLETLKQPIKIAALVGTPVGAGFVKNYEQDKKFAGFDFDWIKIKQNSKIFLVYQSNDDPYVGLENGDELARNLDVPLSFVPNAGHFNTSSGYTKFDDLFLNIQKRL